MFTVIGLTAFGAAVGGPLGGVIGFVIGCVAAAAFHDTGRDGGCHGYDDDAHKRNSV